MSHDNDHETTSNSDRAITELEMLQYLAGEEIDPALLPQAVAIELALHDDLIPDEDDFDGEEDEGTFASQADTVMPAHDYSLATFERLQFAPYKDTMAAKGPIQPGHQSDRLADGLNYGLTEEGKDIACRFEWGQEEFEANAPYGFLLIEAIRKEDLRPAGHALLPVTLAEQDGNSVVSGRIETEVVAGIMELEILDLIDSKKVIISLRPLEYVEQIPDRLVDLLQDYYRTEYPQHASLIEAILEEWRLLD